MNTLIKAAELWLPDADGQLLELTGGLYGAAAAFGFLSRGMCFGRGEGPRVMSRPEQAEPPAGIGRGPHRGGPRPGSPGR